MKTKAIELETVPEDESKENPAMGAYGRAALGVALLGGSAALTFVFADPEIEKQIQKEIAAGKKEKDTRIMYGAGVFVAGIALGTIGLVAIRRSPLVSDIVVGIAAGLMVEGGTNLYNGLKIPATLVYGR